MNQPAGPPLGRYGGPPPQGMRAQQTMPEEWQASQQQSLPERRLAPTPESSHNPPVYDHVFNQDAFPPVGSAAADFDEELTKEVLDANDRLLPTDQERLVQMNLNNRVRAHIERVQMTPGNGPNAPLIEEIREIGSFRKDTMLRGHNVIDTVVVLQSMPTHESVNELGHRVHEALMKDGKEEITYARTDFGFKVSLASGQCQIKVMITTVPANGPNLTKEQHLPQHIMLAHMAAWRHARWWDKNSAHTSVKILVRVLKDMRRRFQGLRFLSVWAIEILSHYAILNTPNRQALQPGPALRRVLQLLACGLLLPGSPSIIDPTEPPNRLGATFPQENQDALCATAQQLLRLLCQKAYKIVFHPETGVKKNVNSDPSREVQMLSNGVLVSTLQVAYNPVEWATNY